MFLGIRYEKHVNSVGNEKLTPCLVDLSCVWWKGHADFEN